MLFCFYIHMLSTYLTILCDSSSKKPPHKQHTASHSTAPMVLKTQWQSSTIVLDSQKQCDYGVDINLGIGMNIDSGTGMGMDLGSGVGKVVEQDKASSMGQGILLS